MFRLKFEFLFVGSNLCELVYMVFSSNNRDVNVIIWTEIPCYWPSADIKVIRNPRTDVKCFISQRKAIRGRSNDQEPSASYVIREPFKRPPGDQKWRASRDVASSRVWVAWRAVLITWPGRPTKSKWVRQQWLIVAGRTGAGFPAPVSDGYRVPELRMRGLVPLYLLRMTHDTLAISLLSLSVRFTLLVDLNWWMTHRIFLSKETSSHNALEKCSILKYFLWYV